MTDFQSENFTDKILEFRKEPWSQVKDSPDFSTTTCLLKTTDSLLAKPAFLKSTGHVRKAIQIQVSGQLGRELFFPCGGLLGPWYGLSFRQSEITSAGD